MDSYQPGLIDRLMANCLRFVRGRFFMTFEFEQPKVQLLKWTVALDE